MLFKRTKRGCKYLINLLFSIDTLNTKKPHSLQQRNIAGGTAGNFLKRGVRESLAALLMWALTIAQAHSAFFFLVCLLMHRRYTANNFCVSLWIFTVASVGVFYVMCLLSNCLFMPYQFFQHICHPPSHLKSISFIFSLLLCPIKYTVVCKGFRQ